MMNIIFSLCRLRLLIYISNHYFDVMKINYRFQTIIGYTLVRIMYGYRIFDKNNQRVYINNFFPVMNSLV
jgi:hypothetical protein